MNTTAAATSAENVDLKKVQEIVNRKVLQCVSFFDSKLSKENERVERYYNQQEPKKQKEGNSGYVSSDVYDSVESMKAQLLEVFGGQYKIVRAEPCGAEDSQQATAATNYVDKVIFKQNDGWFILHDTLDTALKARNAVAQVNWEDRVVYDEHDFQRMSLTDVQALAAQDDVEMTAEQNPPLAIDMEPTYKGTWRRQLDKGNCCIEVLAPEEFFVEKRVKKRTDGARGRRHVKTRQDLLDEGYDEKKVKLANGAEKDQLAFSQEAIARNEQTDEGVAIKEDPAQDELEPILLYETYLDMVFKGRKALYKVVHTDNVIFDCDEVDEDPYVEFVPLRRAHAWYGNNFAAKQIPTQNARTVLTRGVLDHTAQTINPRWQVLNGAIQSPRELMDGRQGGFVNVKMRDGISPLQYPQMNQFVFPVLEMLKTNKEETTGISALSQGLNKDAISTQNSQGLVGDLVALSQVRQKVIARNFAIFVLQLWQKVYKCVVENDKRIRDEYVNGQPVQIDPKEWKRDREFSLSLHLGYGEQEKTAIKKQTAYQSIATDPVLSAGFTYEKRRARAAEILDDSGVSKNVDDWLEPQIAPPQPDPIEQMKAKADADRAQAALLTAQAAQQKQDKDAIVATWKHELDTLKEQLSSLMQNRDADRKDLDVANRVDVSQREITLAENAPTDMAKENVIVSPNG
jgi:hypothetical protein